MEEQIPSGAKWKIGRVWLPCVGISYQMYIKYKTNSPILPTMHFIGRVTMLFANNFLMECLITMKFLHIFFSHPDLIFNSHNMFINASTKEFTLLNNAISSHEIAFEELLYYKLACTSHIMKLAYR